MNAITLLLVGEGAGIRSVPVTGQLVGHHTSWHQLFGPESRHEFTASIWKERKRVLVHVKRTQIVDGEEVSNFEIYQVKRHVDFDVFYKSVKENQTHHGVPYFLSHWVQTVALGVLKEIR